MSAGLAGDARGVVMLEFLLAFVPVLVLFLGALQLALVGAGKLVVQHAAVAGVRSAAVMLDDDVERHGGAACGDLRAGHGGKGADAPAALDAFGVTQLPGHTGDGSRMAGIRRAVELPLAAIVPGSFPGFAPGAGSSLSRALAFGVPATTAVTFPREPDSNELAADTVPESASVSVRVTHLFACRVPVARALLCRTLAYDVERDRLETETGADELDQAHLELERAPFAWAHRGLAASRGRFVLLRAEATLPRFTAAYACAAGGAEGPTP